MAKKPKPRPPMVSRRVVSRREREERYRRWLYVGVTVVVALVLGVLAYGVYQQSVVLPASPVATVNGAPIRTDTYQRWVQYRRYQLARYQEMIDAQLRQLDPNDEAQQGLYNYFQQQKQQLQQEYMTLATAALDDLIDDELIRQEARRRNLSVSAEEVQREIELAFGYDRNPATPAPTGAPLTTTSPITTTPVLTPTPLTTTSPITVTPEPTLTPVTEQGFRELYAGALQEMQRYAGFTEVDYRTLVTTSLLRDRLQEAMASEVPTITEQIHARHILLEKEEDAKAALERVKKGEDFAALAKELTTDTATKEAGGDLGWFPRGQMVSEFEEAAFALQPGQVSEVVQSAFGYHIIKVEERDARRPLDESALAQKRAAVLDEWLAARRYDPQVVRRFWSSDKVPKALDYTRR